jgi:hypothetical protein
LLQCGVPETVTKKQAWMCLLLPLLLLCNPFLAMWESSGALSLCHPPSYRAWVASSELLKFKNTESHEGITIPELAFWEGYTPLEPTLQRCEGYGDTETLSPPIRFRDLEASVRERVFREDLFYRLNVVRISIPPLRERRSDIVPLAEHFLRAYSSKNELPAVGFSDDAILTRQNYF